MYLTKRNIKIKLQQGKAVIMLFLFLFALTANAQQRTGQTRKTTVVRKTTAPQKRTTTVVRKSTTPQKQTTTVVRRTTVSTGKTTQRKTTALQYSCLENPKDKGAWWATVHTAIKSQI